MSFGPHLDPRNGNNMVDAQAGPAMLAIAGTELMLFVSVVVFNAVTEESAFAGPSQTESSPMWPKIIVVADHAMNNESFSFWDGQLPEVLFTDNHIVGVDGLKSTGGKHDWPFFVAILIRKIIWNGSRANLKLNTYPVDSGWCLSIVL
jgi:hypothetical protein